MAWAAAMPSRRCPGGMRMSVSTAVGRRRATASSNSSAVPTAATTWTSPDSSLERTDYRLLNLTVLWGGKTSGERGSAMLTMYSNFSGSCSRPCRLWRAHTGIWCSRTCSYAINSRCSPVRLEAGRMLGIASGTSCCGSSLADSAPAGASICPSSYPRQSCTGIARVGACSGAGNPAPQVDGRISVPRYGT
jgi:hypothetical protein